MFSSGSFTTSTPIQKQHDSGFYDDYPHSRNLSQTFGKENSEVNILPLRKSLFGKRNTSENIPDHQFSQKHKLLLARNSTVFRRDSSSNDETPRTSRSCVGSDKPVHFEETKTPNRQSQVTGRTAPLRKVDDADDSGFCAETPKRSGSTKSEYYSEPLLPLIENSHQQKDSKDKSLTYLKRCLNSSEDKNSAVSASEMSRLYSIFRYQKTGVKPSAANIAFYENNQFVIEENEMFLSVWKEKLERISAEINKEPKVDFLSLLHNMNADLIVSKVFSYLSGSDLQNASCVGQSWRKLILKDKDANMKRCTYLKKMNNLRKEMENKEANPFYRPPNYRILSSIDNIQNKQLKLKRTIKEINFDAFIEVGKSGENSKPMKCPSCAKLSLNNKQVITKYKCVFCGYEFCCNCLKPYTNWHFCASTHLPAEKPPANRKKYLRRL